MKDTVTAYRLKEAEVQQRLNELTSDPSPSTLQREIGLCRLLIEQSVNGGNHQLAGALMNCLNKLARTHDRAAIQANQTLEKSAVHSLVINVIAIIGEELEGLPDVEARLDRAVARISQSIDQATNSVAAIPEY